MNNILQNFLSTKFEENRTVNIVLNLKHEHTGGDYYRYTTKMVDAEKIAALFQDRVNRKFAGNKFRRFGVSFPLVIAYHNKPHKHLHILLEYPNYINLEMVRNFVEIFVEKTPLLDKEFYIEKIINVKGSLIYNSKFNNDRLIIF